MTRLGNWYQAYRNKAKQHGRNKKAQAHLYRMQSLYGQFVSSGDLCFDIGANIGNRTQAFLNLGGYVVAVEPQPMCVETLRQRFDTEPRVTIVDQAIDSEPGQSHIYLCSSNTLSSMSHEWIEKAKTNPHFEGCRWDQKITVQTTTLDALIESYGQPVFCKIDVEGFELNVVEGLNQPITCLSIEFDSNQPKRYLPCLDRISTLGIYQFNYSLGESMVMALDRWVCLDALRNRLDALRQHPQTGGDIYARITS